MLYAVWLNGSMIGRVFAAWPLPEGEYDPVGAADRCVLVTTKIGEFEYQAYVA